MTAPRRDKQFGRGIHVVGVLLGLVAVAAMTAPVSAQGETTEVRLMARQLADGSVEIAVRSRSPGEAWGPRAYPRHQSYLIYMDAPWVLPPYMEAGRWMVSGALEVGRYDVHVVARGDYRGRIEFGVRQPVGEGGRVLLPTRRFFPATPDPDVWYYTSAIVITELEPRAGEQISPHWADGFDAHLALVLRYAEDAWWVLGPATPEAEAWIAEVTAYADSLLTAPQLGHSCETSAVRTLGEAAQLVAEWADFRLRWSSPLRARDLPPDLEEPFEDLILEAVSERIDCFKYRV